MSSHRILWPTDFSDNAAKAQAVVDSLAERHESDVYVLYVMRDIAHPEPWYGELSKPHAKEIMEWESQRADERLDQLCAKYMSGCPHYIKHTAVGDPAAKILEFARDNKIDMIVLAVRGAGGEYEYGRTADRVVRHSPVPVVTVPAG